MPRAICPGSVNLPLDRIETIAIAPSRPLFVYCRSGARSAQACSILKRRGYDARNIGRRPGIPRTPGKGHRRMKVVIIGGVAGGASAAARLRRLDEQAEIVVLERTGYVSYANCGLPYYVGGVIRRKEVLTLQTPQSFRERFRVEVRVHHEAVKIDPASQTVTVQRLDDGSVYEERYDELILSPGARAVKPELPGADLEQIFTLRTVEDTFRIHTYLQSHTPKRAVVIGGRLHRPGDG